MTDEQRERKKSYLRDWYIKNRDQQIANVGKWQRVNREKANATKRAYAAREVANLGDGFVRRAMAQHMAIKGSELPQVLVDAYRELMKLKRAINEKRG